MGHIFWACVWLRCKWWLKRPLELGLLLFIVPLTIVLLATFIQSVTQQEGIPVAIVDEDQSSFSQLVIDRVSENAIVSVQITDKEQAIRLVQTDKVETVMIFREGFMERLLLGERKQMVDMLYSPSSLVSGILAELVSSEVFRLVSNGQAAYYIYDKYEQLGLLSDSDADAEAIEQERHNTALWQEAWAHSDSYWEPEPLMSIRYLEPHHQAHMKQRETVQEQELSGLVRYELQLLMGWLSALLLFVLIFIQQWVVEEKENGVQKRFNSTAVSPFLYVAGHSFPAFLFVMLQGLGTLLLIFWLYDFVVPLTLEFMVLLFIYIVTAFSFSLCVVVWVRTTAQLQGAGIFLVILTSIVGGSFIDLGEWLGFFKRLSYGTPQGWFLEGVKESLLSTDRENGLTVLQRSIWPLVSFTLFFALLTIGRWRKNLDSC